MSAALHKFPPRRAAAPALRSYVGHEWPMSGGYIKHHIIAADARDAQEQLNARLREIPRLCTLTVTDAGPSTEWSDTELTDAGLPADLAEQPTPQQVRQARRVTATNVRRSDATIHRHALQGAVVTVLAFVGMAAGVVGLARLFGGLGA